MTRNTLTLPGAIWNNLFGLPALVPGFLLIAATAQAGGITPVVLKQEAEIPVLRCRPLDLCAIQLPLGEVLADGIVLGDQILWSAEPRIAGSEAEPVVRIVVKPGEAATETSLMISTNRGFHDIRLVRSDTDYTPVMGFTDPEEETPVARPGKTVPLDPGASQ